jgi:hypothetical protein
MTIGEVKHDR